MCCDVGGFVDYDDVVVVVDDVEFGDCDWDDLWCFMWLLFYVELFFVV